MDVFIRTDMYIHKWLVLYDPLKYNLKNINTEVNTCSSYRHFRQPLKT